jgi:hypothetical protein
LSTEQSDRIEHARCDATVIASVAFGREADREGAKQR